MKLVLHVETECSPGDVAFLQEMMETQAQAYVEISKTQGINSGRSFKGRLIAAVEGVSER